MLNLTRSRILPQLRQRRARFITLGRHGLDVGRELIGLETEPIDLPSTHRTRLLSALRAVGHVARDDQLHFLDQ